MNMRVYDTKNRIVNGLFLCLKEKPLKDVLNQDIIKKSEISQRTFYRYYSDKYEILDEFENEFTEGLATALKKDREVLSQLDHVPDKQEISNLADAAFRYTLKFCIPYMSRGKLLLSRNGDINFIWRIRDVAQAEFDSRKKFLFKNNSEPDPLIEKLYVGEIISTIETWLSYADDFSPKQIRSLIGEVQVLSPAELLSKSALN